MYFCFANLELLGLHTIRRAETIGKRIFWFKISVTTIWLIIKELCNATSKIPLPLQTPAHIEAGTMRHYFRKFPFTCGDIFRGHLENGQTSIKLASKTCRMFLESTKISKNQARKLAMKDGSKISFWRRTCPEIRRDFEKKCHKTPWNFLALQRFFTMTYDIRKPLLTYVINYWCNLHISNTNFQNHPFLLFFCV